MRDGIVATIQTPLARVGFDSNRSGIGMRDRNAPQKIVWRSQIVLLAGEGMGAVEVATRVGKSVLTVRRRRRRYAAKGVDGLLKDATRPPGRKPLTARKIKQVVNLTLNEKPPDATHWSERTMAARAGIAPMLCRRPRRRRDRRHRFHALALAKHSPTDRRGPHADHTYQRLENRAKRDSISLAIASPP
jgi:transposase